MSSTPSDSKPVGFARAIDPDLVLLGTLGLGAAVALGIGAQYDQFGLALGAGLGLLLLAGAVVGMARGSLFSRLVLPVLAMAMVALHIQLGRGTLEFHFGVFVTLAILLVYRDWKPLLAGAASIAVHHLLFDRLQAAGVAVYCTPQADLFKVILHAGSRHCAADGAQ